MGAPCSSWCAAVPWCECPKYVRRAHTVLQGDSGWDSRGRGAGAGRGSCNWGVVPGRPGARARTVGLTAAPALSFEWPTPSQKLAACKIEMANQEAQIQQLKRQNAQLAHRVAEQEQLLRASRAA